jgi:hypothetical protein
VGGLGIPGYYRNQIKRELRQIKIDCGLPPESEVKWSKTNQYRYRAQHKFAEYLSELVKRNVVNLHIIFFPISQFDNRANDGREGSVGRIYNEMLIFRPLKFYGPYSKIYLRPDSGNCSEGLAPYLEKAVEEAAKRERRGFHLAQNIRSCLACFKPKDSSTTDILQLLDVTLGALTARREQRENKAAKNALADLVHGLYDRIDLESETGGKEAQTFSIWNFEGRGPKKQK